MLTGHFFQKNVSQNSRSAEENNSKFKQKNISYKTYIKNDQTKSTSQEKKEKTLKRNIQMLHIQDPSADVTSGLMQEKEESSGVSADGEGLSSPPDSDSGLLDSHIASQVHRPRTQSFLKDGTPNGANSSGALSRSHEKEHKHYSNKENIEAKTKMKDRAKMNLKKDTMVQRRRQDIDKSIDSLDNVQDSYTKGLDMDSDEGFNQVNDIDKGTLTNYFDALNGEKEGQKTNKPPPADVFVGPETPQEFPDDSEGDPFYDAIDKGKATPKLKQQKSNTSVEQTFHSNIGHIKQSSPVKQATKGNDNESQEGESMSYEDEDDTAENVHEHDYGNEAYENGVKPFQYGPIEHKTVGQPLDNTIKPLEKSQQQNDDLKGSSTAENANAATEEKPESKNEDSENIGYEPTSGPTTSRDNTHDEFYDAIDNGIKPPPVKSEDFTSEHTVLPVQRLTSNKEIFSIDDSPVTKVENNVAGNSTSNTNTTDQMTTKVKGSKQFLYSDQYPESEPSKHEEGELQPVYAGDDRTNGSRILDNQRNPGENLSDANKPLYANAKSNENQYGGTEEGNPFVDLINNITNLPSGNPLQENQVTNLAQTESSGKVAQPLSVGVNGKAGKISEEKKKDRYKENFLLSKIKGTRIVGGKISGGIISGGYIEGGNIKAGSIEGGVVTGGRMEGGRIKNGTLEGGIFHDGLLEGGHVLNGSVEGGKIKSGNIFGGRLRGGSVEGGDIKGGVMLGGKLKGGSLEGGVFKGGYFGGGSIKSGKMEGGTLTGGEIVGGNLLHGKISGGSLKAGYVMGGEMKNGSIEGGVLKGGSIEGGVLKGGVMEGGKLEGGVVLAGKIKGGIIEGGIIEGGEIGEGVLIKDGVVNGTIKVAHAHHKKLHVGDKHQTHRNQTNLSAIELTNSSQDEQSNATTTDVPKAISEVIPHIQVSTTDDTGDNQSAEQYQAQHVAQIPQTNSNNNNNHFNSMSAPYSFNFEPQAVLHQFEPQPVVNQFEQQQQQQPVLNQFEPSGFQPTPLIQNVASRKQNIVPDGKKPRAALYGTRRKENISTGYKNTNEIKPEDIINSLTPTKARSEIRIQGPTVAMQGKLSREKGKLIFQNRKYCVKNCFKHCCS